MEAALVAIIVLAASADVHAQGKPGPAPLVTLNDGHKMPRYAFGTWLGFTSAASEEHDTPQTGLRDGQEAQVQKAVATALSAGYRHIDTAAVYDTERAVGKAVAEAIAAGEVARDDLFITTKLWNDQHAEQAVVPALCESLRKLDLEYVDLFLIHYPFGQFANFTFDTTTFEETWRGMERARELGLTRSIGVSNFNRTQLERLMAASTVKPAVLQIEINLNLQQAELRAFSEANQLAVMAYTPFGSLFGAKLASRPPPPRANDPALVQIAGKYNKTVPQVALRYLFELGVGPIPKSVTPARVRQNIDIFDFSLSPEERETLRAFDSGHRSLDVSYWEAVPDYPFEKKPVPQDEE